MKEEQKHTTKASYDLLTFTYITMETCRHVLYYFYFRYVDILYKQTFSPTSSRDVVKEKVYLTHHAQF